MLTALSAKNFVLQNIDLSSLHMKETDKIVLLIKASWCGHCNQYFPKYVEESKKYPNIKFFYVEYDDNQQLLKQWGQLLNPAFAVQGYPTLVLYSPDGTPMQIIEDRSNLKEAIL